MFKIHLVNIQKQQMEQAMLLKLFIVKNMIVIYNLIKNLGSNKFFYRNVSIILLVYDITNKESFESLESYWKNEIKVHGDKNVIFAIVGNKSDLYEDENYR